MPGAAFFTSAPRFCRGPAFAGSIGATMSPLSFHNDDSHPGSGVSTGIPRGLLVRRDGIDLVQEGLGLGAVALKRRGITYFPQVSSSREGRGCVIKELTVDSAMVLESPYLPLARLMPAYGLGTKAYMSLPWGQERFLSLRSKFFAWFVVHPAFRPVEALAKVMFVYRPEGDEVNIECTIRSLGGPLPTAFVMNELGAGHFDRSIIDGREGPAPTGWCGLPLTTPTPSLLDTRERTTFLIDQLSCPDESGPRLFWGREHRSDLNWAGFEVELSNPGGHANMKIEYTVRFGRVEE
jgi:hypothetical protein